MTAQHQKEVAEFKESMRKAAKEAFEEADVNKSGYIELSEVEGIVKEIVNTPDVYKGPKLTDEQIKKQAKELLSTFDTNKDNKLNLAEFMTFFDQFVYTLIGQDPTK